LGSPRVPKSSHFARRRLECHLDISITINELLKEERVCLYSNLAAREIYGNREPSFSPLEGSKGIGVFHSRAWESRVPAFEVRRRRF